MQTENNPFTTDTLIHNRYQIKSFLAQGGMGKTFLAVDRKTENKTVLKVLAFDEIENWSKLDLFEREIKTLQNINHPNIPNYIEHFQYEVEGKTFYILVQEYINGKTLKTLIEEGKKFTMEEVKSLFKILLEILQYIHELQPSLIHRDVNPKNIILTEEDQVYLVDFGAVGQVVKDTLMGGNTMVGTMGYMPQEQLYGKALPASDLYGLAFTIIFLLTGKEPASFDFKEMKPQYQPFVNIPPELEKLLNKMTEADAAKRPQSAQLVLDVLEGKFSLSDCESLIEQIPEEVNIIQKDQNKLISIPNKGPMRFLAIFLLFFSIAWNSILIFIAGGISKETFFVNFFLLPFFAVGLSLPIAALYIFFGKTRFFLSPDYLSMSKVLFGINLKSQKIPLSNITAVDLEHNDNKQGSKIQTLYVRGKRKTIKYTNQNVSWLDASPLKKLIELYVEENK